eukprot:6478501-Pyramimonas_sp.AAC.1
MRLLRDQKGGLSIRASKGEVAYASARYEHHTLFKGMGSTNYFVIVSREDHPIYEADLGTGSKVRF